MGRVLAITHTSEYEWRPKKLPQGGGEEEDTEISSSTNGALSVELLKEEKNSPHSYSHLTPCSPTAAQSPASSITTLWAAASVSHSEPQVLSGVDDQPPRERREHQAACEF